MLERDFEDITDEEAIQILFQRLAMTKDQLEDARKQIETLENHLTTALLEYGIAIKALKTIGIKHYYLPQTIACEALKQLGEYEEEKTTDEYK